MTAPASGGARTGRQEVHAVLDAHGTHPTFDTHHRHRLDPDAHRSPTPREEEAIIWPDPSPLHTWWLDVMHRGGRHAAH
ncbi:hypothetical protein ACFYVR_26705 [Rhodococcus sp. NPDC003318]|uniref:hypothetical protein n=1 Tax=Rhodococcus sp. NPDC003318 TaxID=3364503 RepID=UPI0036C45C1A